LRARLALFLDRLELGDVQSLGLLQLGVLEVGHVRRVAD